MIAPVMTAADIIRLLSMAPHPEGGWYAETFRDTATDAAGRARSTAIHYLLEYGQHSHWHRVDAVESWHFYAGDPLSLRVSANGATVTDHVLGVDLASGQRPQVIVPQGAWQAAAHMDKGAHGWTLVGCVVAPGFNFAGFEMAPPDWAPGEGWA